MHPWICVATSSVEGEVSIWDGQTGAALPPLKQNASGANGLAQCGSDYLISAQSNKPAVHVWSWNKDQVLHRCFIAESLAAITCSSDGAYVAGGGASGSLYIWETATGRLLVACPAHYKGISALCFSDTGGLLVSGGEDTIVHAWLLPHLLAGGGAGWGGEAVPSPLHAWSQHTLPVTALCCGAGVVNPILVSASLDRTCQLYSLATGQVLRTISFPAALHSLALDAGEHAVYAGSGDGRVFEASLVGGLAGEGGGPGELSEGVVALEGHSAAVTSLCLAPGGSHLISGSEDGSVRIRELCSRQVLRVLQPLVKGPVTGVLALDRPVYIGTAHNRPGQSRGHDQSTKGPRRPQPTAPLAKFGGPGAGQQRPWEGTPLILDGTLPYRASVPGSGLLGPRGLAIAAAETLEGQPDSVRRPSEHTLLTGGGAGGGSGDSGQAALVSSLQQQLSEAKAAADKWQKLHAELHAFCVTQTLGAKGNGT